MEGVKIAFLHTNNNGVGYYRSWMVERWIKKLGLAETFRMPDELKGVCWTKEHNTTDFPAMEEMFEWADVLLIQRFETLEHIAYCEAMRDMFKTKMVMDIDDNVVDMSPDNPAFDMFQRNVEDTIHMSPVPLVEGSTPIKVDTEKGPMYMNVVRPSIRVVALMQMKRSDAIITSTPGLKRAYADYSPDIRVVMNAIDAEDYAPAPKRRDGTVRIGWAGGAAHYQDLSTVAKALSKVAGKYPQARFVFVNSPYDWRDVLPAAQVEEHPFVPIRAWPELLRSLQFDIGIAPLTASPFNAGKSNIKFMEAASQRTPTVCSAVEPFLTSVVDGETGYIAHSEQEWVERISRLVEEEEERRRVGENAYDEVMRSWTMEQRAHDWMRHFKEIVG